MSRQPYSRRDFLKRFAVLGAGALAVSSGTWPTHRAAAAPVTQIERAIVLVEDAGEQAETAFARGSSSGARLGSRGSKPAIEGGSGAVFVSGKIELPLAATHVGLHWLLASGDEAGLRAALRTSADGQRWTAWRELEVEGGRAFPSQREVFAAPVGADRAHYAQYRLIFTGQSDTAVEAVTATAINVLDGPREVVSAAASVTIAAPGGSTLVVVPREAWGVDEALVKQRLRKDRDTLWPEMYVPAKKIVVHHTAGSNTYTQAGAAAEVRAVWAYHAITQGWGDIGYHFLVDKFGTIYEGRHTRGEVPETREIAGADVVAGHDLYHNYGSSSVSALGNYELVEPPGILLEKLAAVVAFECDRHGIVPRGVSAFLRSNDAWTENMRNISGHYETNATACPGQYLTAQLDTLRTMVEQALPGWAAAPSLSATVGGATAPRELPAGTQVSFRWSAGVSQLSMEGWYKAPNAEPVTYLSGAALDPDYSSDALAYRQTWQSASGETQTYTLGQTGHYALHARTANGVKAYEANLTILVKPAPVTGPASPIHVDSLTGSASKTLKAWSATTVVTVTDTSDRPVAGATVSGSWDGGRATTQKTDTAGRCSFTKSRLSLNAPDTVFTVKNVQLSGIVYDPSADYDADPNSAGTSIRITRP